MSSARGVQSRGMQMLSGIAHWPPLVYVVLGVLLSGIYALGTSVQVLTSEAWMMGTPMNRIDFTAFGQLHDALTGQLAPDMLIPFMFGWGVQFALIITSVGIELPPYPRWRFYLAWAVSIGLIVINSCGDWNSSAHYGFWGQAGFTLVIFFITFCILIFIIMCFRHAWASMNGR